MYKWMVGSILVLFTFLFVLQSQGQERFNNPRELYNSALELYYQDRCEEAMERLNKINPSSATHQLLSYAQYLAGLCFLKMGRYQDALQQFELYLRTYPDGDRVKEAGVGVQMSRERLRGRAVPPATISKKEVMKKGEVQPIPDVKVKTEEVKPLPEMKKAKRRVCAQVFDFNGKSVEEIEKKVKELKSGGVDTVIVRVFQNRDDRLYKFVTPRHEEGVYFKTEHAPVVEDTLGKMAEIAHRNGLDIFAWITTRYANYGLEENPEYRCKSYHFGKRRIEVAKGYNLFHPYIVKRLEGLFRDLGHYPIDGILFQDDLILKHNEDFSTEANKAFLKEFGYFPHPDLFYIDPYLSESGKYYVKAYTDQFWSWANWKNRWLMNVAQRLMAAARESNPNLKFSLNLYYETALNPSNGLAWFSQTLSEALKKDFDYYALMAYHRQTMKELNMEEGKAIDLMAGVARRAVQLIGDPSKVMNPCLSHTMAL